MKESIYGYTNYQGRYCDMTAMLEYESKEAVAILAGQYQRRHNLIAALAALRHAGELDIAQQIVKEQIGN